MFTVHVDKKEERLIKFHPLGENEQKVHLGNHFMEEIKS